jgi:hypothetical protein
MAVINNTCSEIGDVLLFSSQSPIVGIIQLTGFNDSTVGENGTRFFKKEFSYSIDGIFFSDWLTLTNSNLQLIDITVENAFFVNYKYTRSGTDAAGVLQFNNVVLQGVFQQPTCQNYFTLPNSIFKDLFCHNPQHLSLCAVLTKKCYDRGIVPLYMERFSENPQTDDRDYLDFWDAVCCFFALIILYARQFENIDANTEMLKAYLDQRGIFFNDATTNLDLIYLKKNYYDVIRKRGTSEVFKKKGTYNRSITNNSITSTFTQTVAIDGEFLRLINYYEPDELLVNLIPGEKMGWVLGQSSPTYKGTTIHQQLNKTPESFTDFKDKTLYHLYNTTTNANVVVDGSKNVLQINNVVGGQSAGLGPNMNSLPTTDFTKCINVDPGMDYEISFYVKQSVLEAGITFGCIGFDKDNNYTSLLNINDDSASNFFFQQQPCLRNDKYYYVSGIIYNKDKNKWVWDSSKLYFKGDNVTYSGTQYESLTQNTNQTPSTSTANWKAVAGDSSKTAFNGNNLKFDPTVQKIIPLILLDRSSLSGTTGNIKLWDLKVKPACTGNVTNPLRSLNTAYSKYLVTKSNFSTGYVQAKNLLTIYYKNNNMQMSTDDIDGIARKFLTPYDTSLQNIYL